MEKKLMIYSKKDISDPIKDIVYLKDMPYEAYQISDEDWIINCEDISGHSIVHWTFINENFIFKGK